MESNLLFKVILEDIAVADTVFTMDDFETMNILGNRIMSGAQFGDDPRLALTGFFVKQVALAYLELKAHFPSRLSTAKPVGRDYLDTLHDFSETVGQDDLWQNYFNFADLMRHDLISDAERKAYSENQDFTAFTFSRLVDYLSKEREMLLDSRSVLLKGILNEIGRIYNVYGGRLREIYILCLIIALDRYFDYFRVRYGTPSGEVDGDALKGLVFPYIDKIIKATTSEKELNPELVGEIMLNLVKDWRLFFIQYMELSPRTSKRSIELPEESKRKLSEALGKALERQTKI